MLTIKTASKIQQADKASLSGSLDKFPYSSYSFPKSPKFNELRARHEALQKSEHELK